MTEASPVGSRVRCLVGLLPLLAVAACAHEVVAFAVDPPLACPGQTVTIRWQVKGRAALRTERAANDWNEEQVPAQGERRQAVTQRTTFTITAADASPAQGHRFASRTVDMAQGPSVRAAETTCDPGSGKCRGTFELAPGSPALMVRSLSGAKIVAAGQTWPGQVCVSHAGLPATCLGASDSIVVDVAAAGPWTLETDLPAETTHSPPQLRVQLGFGCP